jgi:hypothetical protein
LFWTVLSGAGGIGYQTQDYEKHNAILNDLIIMDWPVYYSEGLQEDEGAPGTLVYYTAFYLPAALVGKAGGWYAANIFWFLWTYAGLLLSLIWFSKYVGHRSMWVPVIFFFAGGLDFFGQLLLNERLMLGTQHVEWWARPLQYSSNSSLLIWVPHHAIGGWLSAALVFQQILHDRNCRFLGLSAISGCLWSPFACLGTLPFLVYGVLKNRFRDVWTMHNFLLPPLIAIILGIYFAGLRHPLPGQFLSAEDFFRNWPRIFLFLVLEVGIYFYLCFQSKGVFRGDRGLLIVSATILLFMPAYRMGMNNDFLIRSSIPALFVLWIFVARACLNTVHPQSLMVSRILIFVFFFGCFPGWAELARSVANYSFGPPPQEEFGRMPVYLPQKIARQYVGHPDSFFSRHLSR